MRWNQAGTTTFWRRGSQDIPYPRSFTSIPRPAIQTGGSGLHSDHSKFRIYRQWPGHPGSGKERCWRIGYKLAQSADWQCARYIPGAI